MTDFVTRFAPSPTGHLHLGHAAAALTVWQAAHAAGGTVLLRIEDIDTARCRSRFTDAIFEDLAWLGLSWPEPVRVQSRHFEDYQRVVDDLAARGLAYRCFRTRAELADAAASAPHGPMVPVEDRVIDSAEDARRLARGEPFAWRLSLAAARRHLGENWTRLSYRLWIDGAVHDVPANPARHGDIIIARKDSPSAYHLAATHDDALQGVTDVIRGEDLADAPHIQTLLQVLMGWPQPTYRHHPLVLGPDGRRLAKRDQSVSLAALRQSGKTASDIRRELGFA